MIPFKETVLDQSLIERMRIKELLDMKMGDSIKSSGTIINLYKIYEDILNNPLAVEVQSILPVQFDTRTQDNYFMLIYTFCKVQACFEKLMYVVWVNFSKPGLDKICHKK